MADKSNVLTKDLVQVISLIAEKHHASPVELLGAIELAKDNFIKIIHAHGEKKESGIVTEIPVKMVPKG